jgi:predicted dehydrogenase
MHACTYEKKIAGTRLMRLGFAGVGWIGRNRLEAVAGSGLAEVSAVFDPQPETMAAVCAAHPAAVAVEGYDQLLDSGPDGIVIATPSALHASQAITALKRGIPVFCQKPLGRTAAETRGVIAAARKADRLLGVDLSYRRTRAMEAIHRLVRTGGLGRITAVEAVFHNAYGPDKPWFYSRKEAGGGCLLDLGIHMVDLALWCLGDPAVLRTSGWSHESTRGVAGDRVEDHATGSICLEGGTHLQLACSWGSHAGCDAEIRLQLFGTKGGACFRNINGSFHDFVAERFHPDRSRELLAGPPDDWGGRVITDWARRLAESSAYNPEIESLGNVAAVLDSLAHSS